jgi:hypothetical protein
MNKWAGRRREHIREELKRKEDKDGLDRRSKKAKRQ